MKISMDTICTEGIADGQPPLTSAKVVNFQDHLAEQVQCHFLQERWYSSSETPSAREQVLCQKLLKTRCSCSGEVKDLKKRSEAAPMR